MSLWNVPLCQGDIHAAIAFHDPTGPETFTLQGAQLAADMGSLLNPEQPPIDLLAM